jgi:hypothetical protein
MGWKERKYFPVCVAEVPEGKKKKNETTTTFGTRKENNFWDSGEETDLPPAKKKRQDGPKARRHTKSAKGRSKCDEEDVK